MTVSSAVSPKKRIESLYLLKAIASFFVVCIHTHLMGKSMMMFILGIGTPCFLAITGYLLFSSDKGREIEKCLKWAKKSFLLAFVCNVVYAIPCIYADPYTYLSPSLWFKTLFVSGRDICFVLWYLTALWQGLLIFALMRKYVPRILYLLPLLYILLYLMRNQGSFLVPFTIDIGIGRNSILTTLTFLSVGYFMHMYKDTLVKIKYLKVIYGFTMLLAFIECLVYTRVFHHYSCLFNFTTFPLIVMSMLLCIKNPDYKLPILNEIGRKHSANIYYFHMLLALYVWDLDIIKPVQTVVVWVSAIPLSMLFVYISRWIRNRIARTVA